MTNTDDFRGYEQRNFNQGLARPVENKGPGIVSERYDGEKAERPATPFDNYLNRIHNTNETLLSVICKAEMVLIKLRGSQPEKGESGNIGSNNPCLLAHLEDALSLQQHRVSQLQKLTDELSTLI